MGLHQGRSLIFFVPGWQGTGASPVSTATTTARQPLLQVRLMLKVLPIVLFALFPTFLPAQLHVYGPGGPLAPMKECADLYKKQTGIDVLVTAGPEKQWFQSAQNDADLVYGGADYMLSQFALDHPGFLVPNTRTELYDRAIGILVRTGNPKHLQSLDDLARPGIRLLDVEGAGQVGGWEDLAGRKGLIDALRANITTSVQNTALGIEAWNAHPELDAWITFGSWAKRIPDKVQLVRIPEGERLYRGTPIAMAKRSTQQARAQEFINFLRTPAAHAVFVRWGWR